jgi:hypothetical protein
VAILFFRFIVSLLLLSFLRSLVDSCLVRVNLIGVVFCPSLFYIRSRVTRHSLYFASSLDSGVSFTFSSRVGLILKQGNCLIILPWSAGYVESTREAMD